MMYLILIVNRPQVSYIFNFFKLIDPRQPANSNDYQLVVFLFLEILSFFAALLCQTQSGVSPVASKTNFSSSRQ